MAGLEGDAARRLRRPAGLGRGPEPADEEGAGPAGLPRRAPRPAPRPRQAGGPALGRQERQPGAGSASATPSSPSAGRSPAPTPSVLLIEGQTLAIDPAGVEVDVAAFERRVAEGTPQALEQAAELYRGDLLLGFSVNEPLFEEWLVAERERLREMALEALARLLAHQTEGASTERAIQTAVRLLALDPLQEAVHRALMRLYARQGRRGAALKQYQVCVGALQRELGTEPEAETKTALPGPAPAPGEAAALPTPGRTRAARVRSTAAPAPPDLPTAETPLFGRQAELGRLRQLLDEAMRGHGHVATVVGEAGIGKTRLVSTLAADALARDCRVLIGRCHESDSILPFGPWVDACRTGAVSCRRGDPRRPAPCAAGRVDPPAPRGGHRRPATDERQRAAAVRERGRADRAGRRPPAAGPRAGGRALGRRDEPAAAGLREPPHRGVAGAPGRHRP